MLSHTLFNCPLSRTTWVSWYQKGTINLDFTEARDSKWQWHQLGPMQVCTSLQTDNHASTPPLSFLQAGCFPAAKPTVSKQRRLSQLFKMFADSVCILCVSVCLFTCMTERWSSSGSGV